MWFLEILKKLFIQFLRNQTYRKFQIIQTFFMGYQLCSEYSRDPLIWAFRKIWKKNEKSLKNREFLKILMFLRISKNLKKIREFLKIVKFFLQILKKNWDFFKSWKIFEIFINSQKNLRFSEISKILWFSKICENL